MIELLVVLAITALLSSSVIIYGSLTRENIAIETDESQVVQLLLRAKSLSVGTYNNQTSPICGYGVLVEVNSPNYYLVSYPKDAGGNCPDTGNYFSVPDLETAYKLSAGFVFDNCLDSACPDKLDYVLFVPPDPQVLVSNYGSEGLPPSNGSGNIYLTTAEEAPAYRAKISVAWGGQISFSGY
jgi:type II secretory pathway pseudopilin PulG